MIYLYSSLLVVDSLLVVSKDFYSFVLVVDRMILYVVGLLEIR